MYYILAGYIEKLADSCIQLAQNDKDLTAIARDTNEALQMLLKRVRALETKQEEKKVEVFVTSEDGYNFPAYQCNTVRDAYYWISSRFIMSAAELRFLHCYNYIDFSIVPRDFKSFKVIKCVIR